jgi:predicted O-methyltransferase YrrM
LLRQSVDEAVVDSSNLAAPRGFHQLGSCALVTAMTNKARAAGNVLRLCLSRGSNPTLHLFNLLASVHGAGLPRVVVSEFQKQVVGDGALTVAPVKIHPHVTGLGSGSAAEMTILASLVALTQPRRLLEFGTCDGASTWHLWANAPADAQITTLDLPSGTKVDGSSDYHVQGIPSRPLLPDSPRIRLIEIDSRQWKPDLREVDFCFIDAGHSYECVRNDTEKALSVMRKGGVVLWHDAAWRKDQYAVNDYLKELRMGGRDVVLLGAGPYDYCALAALRV